MSKILDWIKKHVWQTILIGIGLFFLPLIFVHIAYRIPAISPWFASTWESGELITYIAGFEALLGTIALGAVAVRQSDKANELNERMLIAEEKRDLFERQPILSISKGVAEVTEHFDFNQKLLEPGEFYCVSGLFDIPSFPLLNEVLQIKFVMQFAAASHMAVNLEEVFFLDTNNTTLSEHTTLAHVNTQNITNFLVPDNENQIECLFPKSVLEDRNFCNCQFVISLKNSIDEKFTYKLFFTVIKTKQTYTLLHSRTTKI